MDVYLFSVFLLVAIILLLLLFFKKQVIIGIFSSVFFLICGVLLWSGISFIASTTIVGVTGNYTVVNHYEEWSNPVALGFNDNEVVGTAFVLVGLFLLVVCGSMMFSGKTMIDFGDDNTNDNSGEE